MTAMNSSRVPRPKNIAPTPKTVPFLFYPSHANLKPKLQFYNLIRRTKYHDQVQELRSRRREAPTVPLHDPPATTLKFAMKIIGKGSVTGTLNNYMLCIYAKQAQLHLNSIATSCGTICITSNRRMGTIAQLNRKVFMYMNYLINKNDSTIPCLLGGVA